MARVDDYVAAKKLAVEKLEKENIDHIIERTGFRQPENNTIAIPFLDRVYQVSFPNFEFVDQDDNDSEVPIQEQVLILHYMASGGGSEPTGNWIAYREIQGASFYFSSFVKRAIDPLKKVFGNNIPGIKKSAEILNGTPIENGDAGFEFNLFPKIPLQLILWQGDDEFPAEANILFRDNVADYLSPEDAAWLAGMIVYRLIALSYK